MDLSIDPTCPCVFNAEDLYEEYQGIIPTAFIELRSLFQVGRGRSSRCALGEGIPTMVDDTVLHGSIVLLKGC